MLEKWNNNIAKLQTAVLEWILVCVMWHVAPVPPACLTKDWSPVPVSSYRQLWRLRRRMTSVKIVTLSSYIDKAWFEFLLSYPVSFFCFSPICYVGIEYRRTAFGHTYDHGGHCTALQLHLLVVTSTTTPPLICLFLNHFSYINAELFYQPPWSQKMPYLWSLWVWSHWSLDVQQVERLEIFSAIFWFIANEIV